MNQIPQLLNKLRAFAGAADSVSASALDRAAGAAAQQVVQELRDAGPWWSGDFARAWTITAAGQTPPPAPARAPFAPQTPRQTLPLVAVPLITGRQFFLKNRYTIVNTAPHAAIALDLIPGRWGEDRNNSAPLDWYLTYLNGGQLDQAIRLAAEPVLNAAWRTG
jgi:hypothetical protein